jgi:hypothetical protein
VIGDTKICARQGCELQFVSKTHNQKYHDAECCRLATNAKIMEKYYDKRAQRLGEKRYCTACGNELSRYNSSNRCNSCAHSAVTIRNYNISSMISNVVDSSILV